MSASEVRVPDIGDFADVPVIEIHVAPGDTVAPEDPLVTLESDKATMDIPAPAAGRVTELLVALGDRVSEGTALLVLDRAGEADRPAAPEMRSAGGVGPGAEDGGERDADVVVIGSGPGGYTAAFRAADLGLRTILVERHERLGGVCLNVGCIPSKALLHAARVIAEAEEMAAHGIRFGDPAIDLSELLAWKSGVVGRLTGGLDGLVRQRGVEVVHGEAHFTGPRELACGERTITFTHAIIAVGSDPVRLPFMPSDPRVLDSTAALSPASVPGRLLVVGGGIIGLELATVYDALGSRVTVVELLEELMPGCDPDLVRPLRARIERRHEAVLRGTEVRAVEAAAEGLTVELSTGDTERFDAILVAVGRRPNGARIGAEAAGVAVDDAGFIAVDQQMRTNVPWILAIGDVCGEPMLAHKASHEGTVAAEVIAGQPGAAFDPRSIPSVAYTDPEVAWTGLTELAAAERGIAVETAMFPWAASGRALALGREDGFTKLVVQPGSHRILGGGIVGVGAGELIAEVVHAIELGAVAEDIALTIHPHPTLSETVGFAAEVAEGTITDLPPRRARASR